MQTTNGVRHGQTTADVIAQRADAGKPFMGLLSFSGHQPTKTEVSNAKNYLDVNELKRLNTLVSAYVRPSNSTSRDSLGERS